jgi:hypothetical protein
MDFDDGKVDLSLRERCQVIGITLGVLLVLGFLAWLVFTYTDPAAALAGISDAFRTGKVRTGLSLCLCIVFYVIGLPVGLAFSTVGFWQGALGRRTRLTKAILREMDHEEVRKRHERMLKALDAEKELSRTGKVLQSYLSPAVGWSILLTFLALAVAALVWSATRE